MANGIYDLISRGIQNAKNSVTANNLNNFAENMVPGLEQHINDLENIKNTTRGAEYFRESTNNMIQNLSDAYGRAPVVGGINRALIETTASPISGFLSPLYETYSAYDRMEPGSGFKGFREAFARENAGTAMANRFVGAAKPLANRIESGNFPLSLNNVMNMGRSIKDNVGNFFFSPAGAAEISPTTNRNFDRDFSQFGDPDSFRSMMERMNERPSENTLQAKQTRQASSPRAAGSENIKEEGIFSFSDILADLGRKGVEGFKDIASRGVASQALGGVGTMAGGPVVGGIAALAGLLTGGDMFNSPYIGAGAATMDEYGNMYSAEQLDKMNAGGGYYTDPARASRRRDAGIINMIERRNKGLSYGKDRLTKELAKQAKETAARQSAADAMQDSNRAAGTGGYQSSMRDDTGFMEGPDPSKGESFSSVQGST